MSTIFANKILKALNRVESEGRPVEFNYQVYSGPFCYVLNFEDGYNVGMLRVTHDGESVESAVTVEMLHCIMVATQQAIEDTLEREAIAAAKLAEEVEASE